MISIEMLVRTDTASGRIVEYPDFYRIIQRETVHDPVTNHNLKVETLLGFTSPKSQDIVIQHDVSQAEVSEIVGLVRKAFNESESRPIKFRIRRGIGEGYQKSIS